MHDPDPNNKGMQGQPIHQVYIDIIENGKTPAGMIMGNAANTVMYHGNGDGTDWMSRQNGILAMTPEIGTNNFATNSFFPDQEFVQPIIEANFPWLNYTIYKVSSQLEVRITQYTKIECQKDCTEEDRLYQRFKIEVQAQNLGLDETSDFEIKLLVTAPLEITTVDDHTKYGISKHPKPSALKHYKLLSLEKKTWVINARILKSNSALVGTKTYLELVSKKYPNFEVSQTNSQTLNGDSFLNASLNAMSDEEEDSRNMISIYLWVGLLSIIIIVGAVLMLINLIMQKIDSKFGHSKVNQTEVDENQKEENEDGRINII